LRGVGHGVEQDPQNVGSVARSTHDPPHAVSPGAHVDAQVPREHTRSLGHAPSHAPQWSWLVAVFVSQPSVVEWLQSLRLASHEPTAHTPSAQVAVAYPIEQGVQVSAAQP
jgi:hypothetical protein